MSTVEHDDIDWVEQWRIQRDRAETERALADDLAAALAECVDSLRYSKRSAIDMRRCDHAREVLSRYEKARQP